MQNPEHDPKSDSRLQNKTVPTVSLVCAPQAAVEFLLLARQPQQAFEAAQTHGQMDAYVRSMGSNPTSDDCVRVAAYYETRGNMGAAAQLYAQCGQCHKALTLYMQVSNTHHCVALLLVRVMSVGACTSSFKAKPVESELHGQTLPQR